jgi:hypothetical protein
LTILRKDVEDVSKRLRYIPEFFGAQMLIFLEIHGALGRYWNVDEMFQFGYTIVEKKAEIHSMIKQHCAYTFD